MTDFLGRLAARAIGQAPPVTSIRPELGSLRDTPVSPSDEPAAVVLPAAVDSRPAAPRALGDSAGTRQEESRLSVPDTFGTPVPERPTRAMRRQPMPSGGSSVATGRAAGERGPDAPFGAGMAAEEAALGASREPAFRGPSRSQRGPGAPNASSNPVQAPGLLTSVAEESPALDRSPSTDRHSDESPDRVWLEARLDALVEDRRAFSGPEVTPEPRHRAIGPDAGGPRTSLSLRPQAFAARRDEVTRTVHVTIGRVEVRAVAPVPEPARPRPSNAPRLSLDDYLADRRQGRR